MTGRKGGPLPIPLGAENASLRTIPSVHTFMSSTFTLQWPYTHVLFYIYSTSLSFQKPVLLKSVVVQAVALYEQSMVALYVISTLVEKSKRRSGKFRKQFLFLCVFCDFLLPLHLLFPSISCKKSTATIAAVAQQKLLTSAERFYQIRRALCVRPPYCFLYKV